MKISLVQLKAELKEIQVAHLQLNDFFWGDFHRSWNEGGAVNDDDKLQYPLMCSYTAGTGGNMSRHLTGSPLVIVIADKVFKDNISLDDTVSDTLQVCRDIYNTLNRSQRWRKILTVRSVSYSKFRERGDDEITGHSMQLQVDLKDSESFCNLPMPTYDFESGAEAPSSCPPGTVQNSDVTYSEQVASGGVLELPDITHTDSDGSPVTLPAQTPFVATPCATSDIIYRPPMPSGQWTIFRNFDEGWHVQNGTFDYNPLAGGTLVDLDKSTAAYFTTVTPNNSFGNPNRFTNDMGGSVTDGSDGSTANYIVDNYTGLGWGIASRGPFNWNGRIDDAAALTIGAYSDFRNPSQPEGESISNPQLSAVFNYVPFNLTISIGTSTTPGISTGRAYTLASNGDISFPTKTTSTTYIPVRNHFV